MKKACKIILIFVLVQSTYAWKFFNLFENKGDLKDSKEPIKTDNKQVINNNDGLIEDATLTTVELIQKYGYPSEVHEVKTPDGYILEIHRIPKSNGIPVLLQHGILDSSGGWIIMGPNKSLPYLLSDLGYDVWIGNSRGNRYSQKHATLNPRKSEFWDFSFHEIGIYDLPSMIDYIIGKTKHKKLHYIGHSQGTTAFWVMCSQKPEYCEKIISMQALAPVAFLGNIKSPIIRKVHPLVNALLIKEVFPHGEYKTMKEAMCSKEEELVKLCAKFIYMFTGEDHYKKNTTILSIILGHWPAGASTKQFIHFAQLISSQDFKMFDFEILGNILKYHSAKPPSYDLGKVTAPVALYFSQGDFYTSVEDIQKLVNKLPNVVNEYFIPDPQFSHMEFVMGINNRDSLYKEVIDNMQKLENKV